MGYGAMQLAGPGVWGPPRNVDAAVAVLREAIASGVNHIDTSDFYGPHVTNQIIKKALHPYPADLIIVTKVGARRGEDKSWLHALSRGELIGGVHDNLRNLGVDRLDVVNLRVGGVMEPSEGSIEEPLTVLAELKSQGLIRHIGVSNVTPGQFREAQRITEIVCVQNFYNVAQRSDDAFIVRPVFPVGRIHAVAVIGARPNRGVLASYPNAGRACLASSAFSQHSAHTRHIFDKPSSRKSWCCSVGARFGHNRRAQCNRQKCRGGASICALILISTCRKQGAISEDIRYRSYGIRRFSNRSGTHRRGT
jgi:aryl-alcohol dehydrogenase-like predicted oxidoreductase